MKMKGMLLASLTLLSGAVMLTACSANQRKASDSKTLYLMQTGDILSLDNSPFHVHTQTAYKQGAFPSRRMLKHPEPAIPCIHLFTVLYIYTSTILFCK